MPELLLIAVFSGEALGLTSPLLHIMVTAASRPMGCGSSVCVWALSSSSYMPPFACGFPQESPLNNPDAANLRFALHRAFSKIGRFWFIWQVADRGRSAASLVEVSTCHVPTDDVSGLDYVAAFALVAFWPEDAITAASHFVHRVAVYLATFIGTREHRLYHAVYVLSSQPQNHSMQPTGLAPVVFIHPVLLGRCLCFHSF